MPRVAVYDIVLEKENDMKLSAPMKKVLAHLREVDEASACKMQVTMNTMFALEDRKMIRRAAQRGWFFSPTTCAWKITKLGREVSLD